MNAQSRFHAYEAAKARAEAPVPLLIGLVGPSGSGKTFSALRLATGIQEVVGGEIFVVDTEQRRSLHYADRFNFKHVDFQAPFGSLDYLEALRYCKDQGAGVVVIDSCSHEHDGPGGLLEQHEAELDRIAGNDFKKRDRTQFLAWQKPKAGRRKLINAITTELGMPVIFCFRAKKTTKPVPGKQPLDMGWTSIGADEWMFEMALNALLLPGSNGYPTWHSDMPGEQMTIKLPEQFRGLADRDRQLDENVGKHLANWAAGNTGEKQPKQPERKFEAKEPESGSWPEEKPEQQEQWPEDQPDEKPAWQSDVDQLREDIADASGKDSWEEANTSFKSLAKELPEEVADELRAALDARKADLMKG